MSPDIVHNPTGPIAWIVIPTTPEQDQIVRNVIERWTKKPGWYVLGGRDCGALVRTALNEAGISTILVESPESIFRDLQFRLLNGEDFHRFGYPR